MNPPSYDRNISTVEQLTGEAVVFATSQLTVCVEFPGQETLVFGLRTKNGPEDAVTLTVMLSSSVHPPLELLSRAVSLKL